MPDLEPNPWHGQSQDLRLHFLTNQSRTALREIDDLLDGIAGWLERAGVDPKLKRDLFPEGCDFRCNGCRSFRLSRVLDAIRNEIELAEKASAHVALELIRRDRSATPEPADA